jgi:hypothetical protein
MEIHYYAEPLAGCIDCNRASAEADTLLDFDPIRYAFAYDPRLCLP